MYKSDNFSVGSLSSFLKNEFNSQKTITSVMMERPSDDVDHQRHEMKIVKAFLKNVRILFDLKDRKLNTVDLQRKYALAKAECEMFLMTHYLKDENSGFDLYQAITDKKYREDYMRRIVYNRRVSDVYLKPAGVQVILNTTTLQPEIYKRSRLVVRLDFSGPGGSDAIATIATVTNIRNQYRPEFNLLITQANACFKKEQLENIFDDICAIRAMKLLVEQYKFAIANYIMEREIGLTVEDADFLFNSDTMIGIYIREGADGVDFDLNPHTYLKNLEDKHGCDVSYQETYEEEDDGEDNTDGPEDAGESEN